MTGLLQECKVDEVKKIQRNLLIHFLYYSVNANSIYSRYYVVD